MPEWSPAETESIDAFYHAGVLFITAMGSKPNSCYEVDIERLPIRIFPPQYAVRWREKPCGDEREVHYRVLETFVAPASETVTVHDASGPRDVPVRMLDFHPGLGPDPVSPAAGTAMLHASRPGAADAEQETSTGYSASWDFGEALRRAVEGLPKRPTPGMTDELFRWEVVSSGAVKGGFAGFHHLYVTVRRA
jgi:hypothetical protein